MKCPVCSDENLLMTDRQGVEIDYCPKCRGVWLDRGEMDKIIERSASEPASASAAAPRQRQVSEPERIPPKSKDYHHHSDGYGYRKKKSLLGELFDF